MPLLSGLQPNCGGKQQRHRKETSHLLYLSSMFPSLDVESVSRVAGEEFVTSDVEIEVDERELVLSLGIIV